MLHQLKTQPVSVALLFGSAVCLTATAWLVLNTGGLVYFLTFHAPLHLQLAAASPAPQPKLPTFAVQAAIDQTTISRGGSLAIHVAVTPKQTIDAYLEIWVRGPSIREVYKYPKNIDAADPVRFQAGQMQAFDETYTVPMNVPIGTYNVSTSIVSDNQQIDYYNATNFASFRVL